MKKLGIEIKEAMIKDIISKLRISLNAGKSDGGGNYIKVSLYLENAGKNGADLLLSEDYEYISDWD